MALHAVPMAVTAPRMGTQRSSDRSGEMAVQRGSRSEPGGDPGGGGSKSVDTTAMIGSAIAQELKGTEVKETGDPKTATAIVSRSREVSLPSGTVVTFRQIKPPEQ